MAAPTRDDPLGIADQTPQFFTRALDTREQYERDQRWKEGMAPLIESMVNGTMPIACPWEDKRFQEMVIKALARGGKWRRDAEKLAVIREVFGGTQPTFTGPR